MKNGKWLTVLFFLLFSISLAWASVPSLISYEGRLTDASGNAVTTAKSVSIGIFDAASGGTQVWGPENFTVTPDSSGVFSLILGNTVPITNSVFNSSNRYIQLTVGGEALTPRLQIVSTGYSFIASLAQSVESGSIVRASAASGQFVKQIVAGSGIGVTGDEGSGTGIVTLTATGTGGGTVSQVNTGAGLTGGPITTTGTIALSVPVSAANGGTGQTAYSTGDILYASGASTLSKLPVGSAGQILKVSGGVPSWAASGGTGTVTQVDTGKGLTGGPITTAGMVSIDATVATLTDTQTLTNKTISDSNNTISLSAGTIPNLDASKITTGTFAESRGGTNQSTYATGDILYASGANTLAKLPIGSVGQILKVSGGVPSWAASGGTGTVTQVNTGTGMIGGPITTTGTVSVDVGATANKIVQLDSSAKLPAVDGSALTGLTKAQVGLGNVQNVDTTNASNISSGTLVETRGGTNQNSYLTGDIIYASGSNTLSKLPIGSAGNVLRVSGGVPAWGTVGGGTVTQVDSGAGLLGGPVTSTGTLSVNVGTGANQIVQLDSSAKLPAVDGSALTGLTKSQVGLSNVQNVDTTNASNISSGVLTAARGGLNSDTSAATQGSIIYNSGSAWVALGPGTSGQVLQTQGPSANPQWASAATGSVTRVSSGRGLTGGPITAAGTLDVDVNVVVTTTDAQTLTNKTVSGASNTLSNIADSSLNIISTAGKVSGSAITSGVIGGSTQMNTTGTVTAAAFVGNGSGLSGLSTWNQTGDNTTTGMVTAGSFSTTGVSTAGSFIGNGANLTNLDAGNISAGTLAINRGGTSATSFTASQLVRMNAGGTALESSGKTVPSGNIVGDTDTQALTNKTLDSTNSITAEAIKSGSLSTTVLNNSGLVNLSGAQTLSNKTFAGTTTMGAVTGTSFSGDGSALTNLNAGNIASGTLAINRGGTSATSFTASQLVRMNAGATALESSGKTVPSGNIVGDTDTQTLTNKTLDSTNSITGEAIKSGSISNTVLNNSGLVTLTGAQTLSNKTFTGTTTLGAITGATISDANNTITLSSGSIPNLDASKITTGTFAINRGGTNTTSFTASQLVRMNAGGTALESSGKTVPSGNIVGDTDTQTLTNKTLDSTNSITGEAIKTGLVGTARLGSGTANNTTFLRGDQTWATPGGGGTVTQINTSRGLTGGPITTTGTLTIDTNVVVTTSDAQTLANKSISGASNTLSSIADSSLNTITTAGKVSGGAITSGTIGGTAAWGGAKIAEGFGGTNQSTYTTGDTLYSSAANTLSKLPIGSAGQHMVARGGIPSWETASAGTVTQINTGTGLIGGPVTTTGTISIDSTVATLTGTQALTNKTLDSTNSITGEAIKTGTVADARLSSNIVTLTGAQSLSNKTFTGTTTMAAINSSGQYTNTVATGTAPMVISSTTLVTNLNADKVNNFTYVPKAWTFTATAVGTVTTTDADATASSIVFANWGNSTTVQSRVITKIAPANGSIVFTFSGNLSAGSTTLNYLIAK